MPLNGDKWWAEKPAVVPVKPNIPQVPTHFQPTYQPPGSAQAGFTPFWKTEKFKNFIAGLKSSEPMRVSALTSNIKPLAVTTVARPTARTTPQRPRIPVTAGTVDARFPVGGALNPTGSKPVYVPAGLSPEMREKVVAEMKSRPRQTVLGYQPTPLSETTPGLLVLDPDGNVVRTNEDIIVLSSMGFKDLTPFTTRAGQPQERANLINLAISQGWTDKEIERGLLVYDYFEHSENVGFFNLGTKGKNWVAAAQVNPSIATSFGLNLVNVIELGIETGRLAFNVWKPWRTDPDTGKLEIRIPPIMRWRSPARAEQAIAALEDKLQRWDWIQSPQEKDRLLEQISDIRQDVADMNSEARRVSEAWTAIAGSMDSTAVAVGEANRKFADDVEIVSGRAVVSPSSIYKYFMEPAFDLSEERKGELLQYSNVTSGEVQKIFQTIQSGKVIITPNTMAEIRDLQKRYLQEGISLDLVAADRELTKIKTEDAPFLTTEQVKELQDKALQLQMKANDAYIRAMTNGNFQASQYYSLSYQREPLRLAHFRRNLAEFVIQNGRQPDFSELMRLKQQSENAGTEILGELLFDVTNLIDIDLLFDAVPILRVATKVATDNLLWKPLRIIAENTPVLKFFIKESNMSVATRFADMVSDTFGKIIGPFRGNLPEFSSDVLPRIGKVFDDIRHASAETIRTIYGDITNPASKAYIRGMENMSYQEFYRLRNMADEVTGVAGEGWKELYEKAYDRSLLTHEMKSTDVLRGRDYRHMSEAEKAIEIKKSVKLAVDEGQVDMLANKLFSENFKDAFLKSHRVSVGKEASKLLDDTVFGQMIQKLRFLGDQAADMPRAEELKKIVGAQDLLNSEIAAMDYLLKDEKWITRFYKKVVKAVVERKMSFGDVLDSWLITKGREMGKGGFKVAADWMENTHWILTKMYEGWVMAVLSLNPRWFIQNFIDSSFRTIAYGGNPLEDIHMLMTATHKHLADQLGVVPGAIGQNLARGGIDETYSVASRILYEGWKPTYGPFSWIKFEYDRIVREGVRNLDDAPAGIRKMYEARIPKTGFGKHLQALGTGFRNTLLALPGAASDFNTAIEFTIRLRMFSREYFKLYDALNPIAKNIGAERLTATVRTLFERVWDASGGNATMMNSIVNNIVESTIGAEEGAVLSNADRLSKSWSLLFNAETVDSLSALTSVEKHAFLADMTDRFNDFRGEILKAGRDVNEKDVAKFIDDMQSGVNTEFTARIKKYNETLGANIDLKDNPDGVPPKPTWDDASKFESSTFAPPTRATRNISLKQMWKNAKDYFIPSVGKEVRDAVVSMRSVDFLPAEKSIDSFTKAMSGFADVTVSELSGRKMHAWVDEGGITHLELPKEIFSTDKGKVKAKLIEGIAHALAARDARLIASAFPDMPLEDVAVKYRADFIKFTESPASIANENTMSFYVISSQLHADPSMREMLERMYNRKLDFESVAQLKRNAGLSYMEIMRGEWATEDNLLKLGDPMPIDVKLAGKVKAYTTVSLFNELEKNATGDLRLELVTYLENSRIASGLFDNFLQEGYPGYRKLRGKLRRDAAVDRYALLKNSYELLTAHNRTLIQMTQSAPDVALEYLRKFNDDFATNYLEHSGITNIVRTVDGGVSSFDIAAQGKKKTIRHTSALQGDYGIESYFFGEFNHLKRNTTVTIDPTKFLEEGKSAVEQIQSALIHSFGLTDPNARDVSTILMKRAEDIASRLNQPLDAVLRDRYGFAKTGRRLSAGNGVLLSARNPLNMAEERFTFYGSGSNNILGVMTQLSQMHYQDLMYMAKFGDLRAGADLRAINARISAVTKTDVALTGKLTDRQAEVLADAYLEWVKNGVTEVHGLKGPLTRLSQQVAHVVEHMGKDFKRLDTDSLALLERAFFTTGDKIPSANSYMIRSMAKKQGLSTRATDLLRMINAHPDVLGMSDVHKTKFVDGLIALGRPADEAEFTYDLFRLVSFSKNPEFPGAWLAKHELIKGEELDLEAFARASKSIPILFSDVDPSVVQNMVDFVFRKVNRGENVNLVSTFSNMIIEAGSDLERTYILKFINETDPSLQSDIVAALKKHYRSQGLVDAILEQANDLPAYDKRVGGVVYSTDSDAFKSWFKTSVATDADGMPKVMYAAPAAIGEDKQFGENLANSLWTSSAKNDLPVYVSVQNPFILDKTYTLSEVSDLFFTRAGSIDEKIVAKLKAKNLEVITGEDVWKVIRMTDANADEFFTKYGFDGLSKGEQIIPFKKSQIKSVFNMGTWSGSTDDMLFQRQNILKNENFKKWFGDSPLVDNNGNPIVLYHGTTKEFEAVDPMAPRSTDDGWYGRAALYLTPEYRTAESYPLMKSDITGANVIPSYVSLQNPFMYQEMRDAFLASSKHISEYVEGDTLRNVLNGRIVTIEKKARFLPDYVLLDESGNVIQDVMNTLGFSSDWVPNSQPRTIFERIEGLPPTADQITDMLKSQGYDGVIVTGFSPPGNRWQGETSIRGLRDNYVVREVAIFEPTQVKSIYNAGEWSKTDPRLLHQDTKGAFWISNGQRRIAIWESADVSTVTHELGHSALKELAGMDDWRIRTVEKNFGIPEGKFMEYQEAFNLRTYAERGLTKANVSATTRAELEAIILKANIYVKMHEDFTNGMTVYLHTREAPTPELKSVFEWFRQQLSIIWSGIKDMLPSISEDMVKVYDSVFTSGVKIPKQRYSSLGDVPLEIAEKVLGEGEKTRMSNEMNAAFAVYKQQEMFKGFSEADLGTFQGFKDVINNRIEDAVSPELENVYRAIMYNLEHLQTEVGKYHMTDELLEFLQPKIRDYDIGPSTKTVLAHNLQNIQVKEGIDNALSAMRTDWTRRVRGGGAILPILSRAEADELLQHTTKAARMKSSLTDVIVNGGKLTDDAGQVIAESEGALAKTNHVLLDYSKRSNLDNFMKIFFPFWMFPSRSIPFWAEALVMHPWIGGLYYKLQRMSETQRIQAGAVDSRGNPIKSLKGYIRMGTSDVWINPLAPMSFRYLLDMAQFLHKDLYAKPQADEGDLVGLPYVVKEFLQTAPIIGFNVAPWWSYAFKKGLNIPDDVMPNWAIAPQFGLLPKSWTKQFTNGISEQGGPLHSFLTRWIFPEPNWQDSLIETRIREEAYQRAQEMTQEEFKLYQTQVETALKEKGDNPIWVKAFQEWSMDESKRNQLAFWTGVYPKTFNDAQADLIGLKTQNTLMIEAQNNNWVASAMGLPADEQARWDARQALRYGEGSNADTPEAWLNRLYTYTNWITNEEGKVVTEPKERAKIIATRAEEIELSRQAYFDAKQARIDFDDALSRVPIGSPKEITEPIYREYYDRITEIYDRVPDYGEFFLSAKPVRLIEQDLRRDWWQLVKMSRPVWDGQPENYAKYEAAVAAWEAGLGSPEYSFFPAYIQSVMQRKVEMYQTKMKPDQLRNFNKNLVIDLVRETNRQGYQMYRLENDTVYDAAVEVYMRNYWNKYWDSIEGLKGDARSFADATFQWTNPPPNARTLHKWITELYGNRFSLNEVMTLSEEGQIFSYSIKERMNYNKTKEELMRDDSYNLLMWAGPGTHRDALNKAYQAEGGGSVDIDRFYWSDGHGFTSSEELKLFYERLTRAAVALGLKAPTGSQFQERMKVLELNEKFKEQINTELGYDFLRIENPEEGVTKGLNQWYNGLDFDMQKAFRDSAKIDEKDKADWARIQTYRKKREEYAKANPLWALYYYEYKKPKDLDIKPSFEGTAKPAVLGVEPGDTSLAFQTPRGVGAGSGMAGKSKKADREDLGGVPPSPVKRVSKLSIVQWPEGFRATVGDTVADEIEGLLKYGRYLSAPAKQYLYELAKRHRNWRGFIYSLLQR